MFVRALPALLVPGTLCDDRLFAAMRARLDLDAIVAPPIAQGGVEAAAQAAVADEPERFVAIGFSLGAFAVLEMLRSMPERVAGAILIAGNAQALQAPAQARRDEVELARVGGFAPLIEKLWPRYVARAKRNDAELKGEIVAMAQAVGVERFAAQAELAISRPDSSATLRDSQVPLLLISGDEDGMIPRERYAATAEAGGMRWVQLEGVGHFAPLEAPDRCATAIGDWLREMKP